MPSLILRSSPLRCCPVPGPAEPNDSPPWMERASLTRSSIERTGSAALTNRTSGDLGNLHDRDKIGERIVRKILVQGDIGCHGSAGGGHERIPVRRRMRD